MLVGQLFEVCFACSYLAVEHSHQRVDPVDCLERYDGALCFDLNEMDNEVTGLLVFYETVDKPLEAETLVGLGEDSHLVFEAHCCLFCLFCLSDLRPSEIQPKPLMEWEVA